MAAMTRRCLWVLVCVMAACAGREEPAPAPAPAPAPDPLVVSADGAGVFYRFLDPQAQTVGTAATLAAIPEAARAQVILFDSAAPAPAGWEHVLDLSGGYPATSRPMAGFQFQPEIAAPVPVAAAAGRGPAGDPVAAGPGGAHEVIMFSTQGCGYCRKARRYLSAKSVPYTELDLERDPKAGPRLAALGQKAGLSGAQLQGVPIFFIDGQPVKGFDKKRLNALLGL